MKTRLARPGKGDIGTSTFPVESYGGGSLTDEEYQDWIEAKHKASILDYLLHENKDWELTIEHDTHS